MALAGKSLKVRVSTTAGGAGTYTDVAELNSASMSQSGTNFDVSAFADTFIKRLQGLKDASYQISGFWVPTDTNGQVALRNAWLNDTTLWVQFLPNGTAGFKQEVKVSQIDFNASVDGAVEFSATLEGTGAIVAV